jgi:twitching motility protein PilT
LTVEPAVARLLEHGDLAGIRTQLNAGRVPSSHTMNSMLEELLSTHKVSVEAARAATTDRIGFADMV